MTLHIQQVLPCDIFYSSLTSRKCECSCYCSTSNFYNFWLFLPHTSYIFDCLYIVQTMTQLYEPSMDSYTFLDELGIVLSMMNWYDYDLLLESCLVLGHEFYLHRFSTPFGLVTSLPLHILGIQFLLSGIKKCSGFSMCLHKKIWCSVILFSYVACVLVPPYPYWTHNITLTLLWQTMDAFSDVPLKVFFIFVWF